MTATGPTILWLRQDLRLVDSRAVARVLSATAPADLVVVRTGDGPFGCVEPTVRRIARERERFDELRAVLARAGVRAVDATREGPDDSAGRTIVGIARALGAARVVANAEVGDALGFERDRRAARMLRDGGTAYEECADDGIARGSRPAPTPFVTGSRDLPPLRFAAVPGPIAALRAYLERLPYARYRRDMWTPGPDARASSRLSIDLACGAVSGDRVERESAEAAADADPRHADAFRQFAARIAWRRQFVQTLETNVAAFPWGRMRDERPEDAPRMAAWLAGATGHPLVDAAMRDLTANGWINFRLRQVLCSYAIDLLALDMHLVGVALGGLFDDYSPGIHWPQIGLQFGMSRGRGPRVVNPVKQARELDPEGRYVRRHLPELARVATSDVFEPWLAPSSGLPRPIVDYASAARAARERHPA